MKPRKKPLPADGSAPKRGPAPSGVVQVHLCLTPGGIRRLDLYRDRLRVEAGQPRLSRSQAAERLLATLPDEP